MDEELTYELDPSTYEWSVRLFNTVRRVLKVHIKMHHSGDTIHSGEIFVFNHFARFETFIPQYLIYLDSGAFCRSVAAAEFFHGDERLTNYLVDLGAVPNDHPRLLPLLAAEALHGRKIVIFPEGGMVKDRRVVDESGEYGVYSRRALGRRRHHSGAAALANGLEAFRVAVREAARRHDHAALERWMTALRFANVEALLTAVQRPTTVVPANITFYPLRVRDNRLRRMVERVAGQLSPRAAEEIVIESNILLADTDMDIRVGTALTPATRWGHLERWAVRHLGRVATEFDDFFARDAFRDRLRRAVLGVTLRRSVERLRDEAMHAMYGCVTVNLSHLASRLMLGLHERGERRIATERFHRLLYYAVKRVQSDDAVYLHRSLRNPENYGGLPEGICAGLAQFLDSTVEAELVDRVDGHYVLLDKLGEQQAFDAIRIENPIAVYANEAAPVATVEQAIEATLAGADPIDRRSFAELRFDDELRAWHWDRDYYRRPRYDEINSHETATESGEPFLFLPQAPGPLGVVLLHGLLASPAEVRVFGEKLAERGYPVVGPRLKGHGSSPWDLRGRSWTDWLDSVRRGYEIMAAYVPRVCMVGFSTGAALALVHAATLPQELAGVVAISTPLRFRNRNMVFVPLMHGANRLIRSMSPADGIMPFRLNESEHPHINYRHVPIRALYELRRLVEALERDTLRDVRCPVKILQGTDDIVVDPRSADILYDRLGSTDKSVVLIPSKRHGILTEEIGDTHRVIEQFLHELAAAQS
ncbi:MAG: alpha/beta fold hydrolase [Gammaproteobacteria bacterium]|nr:alpha/beta fold hydrolase [Gammaproteobacteria bacterium]